MKVVTPFIVAPPEVIFKLPSIRISPSTSTAYGPSRLSVPIPTLPGIYTVGALPLLSDVFPRTIWSLLVIVALYPKAVELL